MPTLETLPWHRRKTLPPGCIRAAVLILATCLIFALGDWYGSRPIPRLRHSLVTVKADHSALLDDFEKVASERDGLKEQVRRLEDGNLEVIDQLRAKAAEVKALRSRVESLTSEQRRVRRRPTQRVSRPTAGWRSSRASWYGAECYGHKTADGTLYTPATLCVAHKSLPLGTRVEIRYRGRSITTTVRDRGPFVAGREFDLSNAVAKRLGFSGVQTIEWRLL